MFKYPIGNFTKEVIKSFLLEKAEDLPGAVEKPESEMTEEEKEQKKKEEEAKKKELEDQEKINASPFKVDGEEKPDYTKEFKEKLKNLGVHIPSGDETEPSAPPRRGREEIMTTSEKIAAELGVGGHKAGKGSGGRGFGVGVHPGIKDQPVSKKDFTPAGVFNPDVLLGPTKEIVGDQFSSLVMQPYKELQYIKLARSIMPDIAAKAQGFADAMGAGEGISKSFGVEGEKYKSEAQIKSAYNERKLKKTIVDPAILSVDQMRSKLAAVSSNKGTDFLSSLDDESLKDFYTNTYQMINMPKSSAQSGASALARNIDKSAKELAGMGGLDPFFAQELSAKLRGGEWVETMTKEIGPTQERGAMSSMGHRRSAVSGF